MIAVVGATGNTGRAVVKELKELGQEVLCVVRDPNKARTVLGPNVKSAVAELHDRGALKKALEGSKRIFMVTGHNPQMGEQQINVLEAARAVGAELIIKVSGGRAVVGSNVESVVGRGHHEVEEAIRKSGLDWVILRPGLFMQNTLQQAQLIKNEGKMVLPFAKDLPISFIDVRDTGAIGARILVDPKPHVSKSYEFTGKQTNLAKFAEAFSQELGKTVIYIEASLEQAGQALKARGLPDWLVAHQLAMARAGAKGAFTPEKTEPIKDIVGRDPITTRQFVRDHKQAFA